MKNIILSLLSTGFLLLSTLSIAHTPLFDCFDNGDDTITCEGGFSDGTSAQGIKVSLVDAQGKVLEQATMAENGSVKFTRPAGEFTVVFDAGSSHNISVLGDDIY